MNNNAMKIEQELGHQVLLDTYQHYDLYRARHHLPYKPADVLADINSERTYVGKLKFLHTLYPNRHELECAFDHLDNDEYLELDCNSKDYELIWVKDLNDDETVCVAEIKKYRK